MLRALGEAEGVQGASLTPLGRMVKPEEVAIAIGFLLGEESSSVTGSVYCVDGSLTC